MTMQPLLVNRDAVSLLLSLPEFKQVNTQALCIRALRLLMVCKLMPFPITERALAIAILMGLSEPGQPKNFTHKADPQHQYL